MKSISIAILVAVVVAGGYGAFVVNNFIHSAGSAFAIGFRAFSIG